MAGRYRLIAEVGAGGLASVWEAEHVTLHSRYAVKFLNQTGPADGEPAQRFLREARIAASVKQRNVLEIVDFGFMDGDPGASERGVPYMVMELLRGRTLGALLAAEGKLGVRRAVDIASGVLRGLTAVHAAGLLHRDVKPHNVFLVEDEDGAFPKLVDFGLSRRTGRSDLTLEGTMLGTPLYMAPEQIAGRGDLDARVDIYAMGVVLYEMLAGEPPYNAPTITELLDLVAFSAPPSLVERVPGIPPALVEVVETAMQKTRERRFPDARAMRAALLDAMAPDTGAPMRISTPDQGVQKLQRPAERPVERPVERTVELATTAQIPPPVHEPEPEPERPAPRESSFLVFVRASVLAALAIGVAVLVLDGPWTQGSQEPTPSVALGADGGAPTVGAIAEPSPEPALPEAVPTAAVLTATSPEPDAAPEIDAALDEDDVALDEDDEALDEDEDEEALDDAATEAEPQVARAGTRSSPRRTVTTRRSRHGRTVHSTRSTRRHRTTTHRRRTRWRRPR